MCGCSRITKQKLAFIRPGRVSRGCLQEPRLVSVLFHERPTGLAFGKKQAHGTASSRAATGGESLDGYRERWFSRYRLCAQ
jgi:hypothetical protein